MANIFEVLALDTQLEYLEKHLKDHHGIRGAHFEFEIIDVHNRAHAVECDHAHERPRQ